MTEDNTPETPETPPTSPERVEIEVLPMEVEDGWLTVTHYSIKTKTTGRAYLFINEITAIVQLGNLAEIVISSGPCSILVPYSAEEIWAEVRRA